MAKESIKIFFQILDYMEGIWIYVLNRTDKILVGVCRSIVKTFFEYIALNLMEDKRLVECWYGYCSEIDRRSET